MSTTDPATNKTSSSGIQIPYERIVQWAAGPISIIAGYLGTQLTTHIGLFGSLGISKDQTARAIVTVGTFGVGTLVTYAAHHKWLSNVPKWWDTVAVDAISENVPASNPNAAIDEETVLPDRPDTAVVPDGPSDPAITKARSR